MRKLFYIVFILLMVTVIMLLRLKSRDLPFSRSLSERTRVLVVFFDIGQGDAAFIEWPDGTRMLVDCSRDARILEALGRIMPYYDKIIDYMLVTHPDSDHYGGCVDVMERFDIKNIIYTGLRKEDDGAWRIFWEHVLNEGADYHRINKEDIWNIGGSTLHFLYPDHSVEDYAGVPGISRPPIDNNTSIVFKLSVGLSDILFTGDAEADLEKYLVNKYGDQLDSDVLKIGHHGSGGSSIPEFISHTSPDFSVISVGKDNKFGHPSRRVIKRLERAGSDILRTDLSGDVKLYLYEDHIGLR